MPIDLRPKWTPGPWERPFNCRYVVAENGETIITGYDNENAKIEANFTLAAAAPELYDALAQYLLECGPSAMHQADHAQLFAKAQAALAKARGDGR